MIASLEQKIYEILTQRGLSLAAAESCTGGLVASRITDVPGSSAYFIGGAVTYANEAKANLLGVSWDALQQHGAVSEEVVRQMADGARNLFHADIAVSVSGVAGPGGGTELKPVGYTWLGLSTKDGTWARNFTWQGNRLENKRLSADAALQLILDYLEGNIK